MQTDFLLGDRMFPVGVVSLRMAATILAVDMEAHYTDAERAPYMAARYVHQYETIEPIGALRRARSDIESAMRRDIDAKRLRVLRERRKLAGECVADETILDMEDVWDWAEVHGIQGSDALNEYDREERKISGIALSAIADARDRYKFPEKYNRSFDEARELDFGMVAAVLRENARLHAENPPRDSRPSRQMDPRERATYLCIIRALGVLAQLPDRGAAVAIDSQIQALGFDGPKDSTIRKVIEAARALEPDNKPL